MVTRYYKIATLKKSTVIGQTEFITFPPCMQPTSYACIAYQHKHATTGVILFAAKSRCVDLFNKGMKQIVPRVLLIYLNT